MDNAFELASNTPVSADALRAAAADGIRAGALYRFYANRSSTAGAESVGSALTDVDSLEEQVRGFKREWTQLFTLAHLFRATLRPPQNTDVPGHGTVSDIGIADGPLGIQQNLLVEGTLLVAGDLTVGGQCIVGEQGVVIVTGSLHTSALAATGQVCVGGDLRAMFMEVTGNEYSVDVGGELDSFLLIQNDHVARASNFSVGVHAVYPEADAAAAVFQPTVLGADGRPDWTAVARAARAGEDIFVDGYRTPKPARGTLVERL